MADGTLSGHVTSRQGAGSSDTSGKWSVDENGRACVDEYLSAWNMRHTANSGFPYRLGDRRYRTVSDSEDRDTKVLMSAGMAGKVD